MLALSGAETEMEEKEMNCLRIAIWICSCLAFTSPVLAVSVTLAWDPVIGASSYRLYVGIQSLRAGNPPLTFYQTNLTEYQVDGLDVGTKYFFCATALGANGVESEYSNEVAHTPILTPVPIQVVVTNPSFDDNQFNRQYPSGWREWGTTNASYTETFGGSHSGARHLTHYHSNAYRVYTYQILSSLPPGNYRVEVWAMTPTGGQTSTGIALKENGIQKAWLNFPIDSIYNKLSATVNVLNSLEIGFWTDSPVGGKWSYIDDITVVVVP
jgi:hypothetical protein